MTVRSILRTKNVKPKFTSHKYVYASNKIRRVVCIFYFKQYFVFLEQFLFGNIVLQFEKKNTKSYKIIFIKITVDLSVNSFLRIKADLRNGKAIRISLKIPRKIVVFRNTEKNIRKDLGTFMLN